MAGLRRKTVERVPDTQRSVAHQAAAALRRSIVNGELTPGDRLGQDLLREQLGVGTATFREAVRQLEAEGLVEHRPNRGVFVLGLGREEMYEVVTPVRVLLERYALRRAMALRRDDLISGLEQILETMAQAVEAGDLDTVSDADVTFHEYSVLLCGQPHTVQLWNSITPRLRAEFARLGPREHSLEEIHEQHTRILDGIRVGDPRLIDDLVYEHAVTINLALGEREIAPGGVPPAHSPAPVEMAVGTGDAADAAGPA